MVKSYCDFSFGCCPQRATRFYWLDPKALNGRLSYQRCNEHQLLTRGIWVEVTRNEFMVFALMSS